MLRNEQQPPFRTLSQDRRIPVAVYPIVAACARPMRVDGFDPALLDDSAVERSIRSIEITQAILGDHRQAHTLKSFCAHNTADMDRLSFGQGCPCGERPARKG